MINRPSSIADMKEQTTCLTPLEVRFSRSCSERCPHPTVAMSTRSSWSVAVGGGGETWSVDWKTVAEQYLDGPVRELPTAGVSRTIVIGTTHRAVREAARRVHVGVVVVRARHPFGRFGARPNPARHRT
jgi:hypothetical protein